MRVKSVNVGMPREVEWQESIILTGIFKEPATGPIALRRLNFAGDAQADLSVHGGPDKAVYAYPSEHYQGWETILGRELLPGAFGENLTTEGLIEDHVCIGDELRIGSAIVVVTQPRLPCYKLGIRFGDPKMVKMFLKARRPGIYFAVLEEGVVGAGDPIELVQADERRISIIDMLTLIFTKEPAASDLQRIISIPGLAAVWQTEFQARLADLE
jgi:MOSC domain-containing protein YiiM